MGGDAAAPIHRWGFKLANRDPGSDEKGLRRQKGGDESCENWKQLMKVSDMYKLGFGRVNSIFYSLPTGLPPIM